MTIFQVVAGPIAGALVTVVLAWIIGNRITARWAIWQKRREATLAASSEFSRLYGEFFSNWKLWNYSLDGGEVNRVALIERVHAAEARVEALFVILAVQSSLTETDIEVAGKFRQAYQQLREAVLEGRRLDWPAHNTPGYAAFKSLAASFAVLLSSMDLRNSPSEPEASRNIAAITHNKWEKCWQVPCSS